MSKIDSLLTKYVDSINSGLPIDINAILEECPDGEREELRELITVVDTFRTSYRYYEVRPQKAKKLFSQLESIRLKNRFNNQDSVVNYRKDTISNDEAQKLNNKLDEIFKKEFGEE
ncbi:MAG: hypothetical protein PHC69_09430 [Ruminiclostridium sp.]|nr:hypothetical protein [Ruminiclostridium sp.]